MRTINRIERIREKMGLEELLVLLSEEADELEIAALDLRQEELLAKLAKLSGKVGHAALKLRRALNGSNPTPVTLTQARENLLEELADVSLCLLALNLDTGLNRLRIRTIMEQKLDRWEQRLDKADRTKGGQAST